MIGIVLLSHGKMAEGLYDSATLFFGKDVEQITYECLMADDDPEEFDERIKAAISKVDTGSGTIVLCDLLGGTPCNRCAYILNDRVQVISGMNLSILLELLGNRLSVEDIKDLDIENLISVGQQGQQSINKMMAE